MPGGYEVGRKIGRASLPWLRRLFLVVAGLYLFYLVGMNALFWSGGFERLMNGAQKEVRIEFSQAWTVRPFFVHVRDLSVIVDEPAVQLAIAVDEAEVGFHLLALRDNIVHMYGVRGGAFSFRLRERAAPGTLTPEWLAAVPPIPGVAPPIEIIDPHPDYDLSNNWNVRMDDIDVSFREIWIDAERFVGQSRVRGGFYLRTEDSLVIDESSIDFDHGAVFVAHRLLAASLSGSAGVTLDEIDFQEGTSDETFEALVIEADLEAFLAEAGAIEHHLPEALDIRGGMGPLRLKGALTRGVIVEGTRLDLDLRDVAIAAGPIRATTPIVLQLTSDGERLHGELELGGTLGVGKELPSLTVSHASIEGSARAANLRAPLGAPEGKIDLQGGTTRFSIAGEGDEPRIDRGQASFSTQLEVYENGVVSGAVGLRLDETTLRWGKARFDGEAAVQLLVRGATRDGPLRLDRAIGGLTFDGMIPGDEDRFRAKATLNEARGSKASGEVGVEIALTTLAPLLDMPPMEGTVPGIAEALLDLEDVRALVTARWNEERLILSLVRMECDSCAAAGHWRFDDGPVRGAAMVRAGPITVGVVTGPNGSDTTLFPGDAWKARHLGAPPGEARPRRGKNADDRR